MRFKVLIYDEAPAFGAKKVVMEGYVFAESFAEASAVVKKLYEPRGEFRIMRDPRTPDKVGPPGSGESEDAASALASTA